MVDYPAERPILIQQHVDKSSFFDRSWNEFRVGFGNPSGGNFWLGNERIHQLTKDGGCKLRLLIQQEIWSTWYRAEYSTFIVDAGTNNYQLTVAGFSGAVFISVDIGIWLGGHFGCIYGAQKTHLVTRKCPLVPVSRIALILDWCCVNLDSWGFSPVSRLRLWQCCGVLKYYLYLNT